MNETTRIKKTLFGGIPLLALAIAIGFTTTIVGAEPEQAAARKGEAQEVEAQTEQTQTVQIDVEEKAGEEVADKRKEVIKEATGAIAETRKALASGEILSERLDVSV